jgi:hypothetical protein
MTEVVVTTPRRRMSRRLGRLVAFGLMMGMLGACASRAMGAPGDPALVRGLVDGILAPLSFLVSLFTDDIRMYAFPNVGRWYDFGFLIGLACWGGGAAASK